MHQVRLYERVSGKLEEAMRVGALRPGDRLPSVRGLSEREQVSVSTVLQAYLQLEARGLIEARPQSGHYVRRQRALPPEPPPTMAPPEPPLALPPPEPDMTGNPPLPPPTIAPPPPPPTNGLPPDPAPGPSPWIVSPCLSSKQLDAVNAAASATVTDVRTTLTGVAWGRQRLRIQSY